MSHDVFVSYASRDEVTADAVCAAVVWMARLLYREPYAWAAMGHERDLGTMTNDHPGIIRYHGRYDRKPFSMAAKLSEPPHALMPGSEAEFITTRGWGYTTYPDRSAREYRVTHPPWHVANVAEPRFDGDGATLYGAELGRVVAGAPRSAFYAGGSAIGVYGRRPLAGREDLERDRHPA